MVYLTDEFVLKEVLPDWNIIALHKMVFVVEPVLTNLRKGVATDTSVSSSREEPCHENQWKQSFAHSAKLGPVCIIGSYLLKVINKSFLRSS